VLCYRFVIFLLAVSYRPGAGGNGRQSGGEREDQEGEREEARHTYFIGRGSRGGEARGLDGRGWGGPVAVRVAAIPIWSTRPRCGVVGQRQRMEGPRRLEHVAAAARRAESAERLGQAAARRSSKRTRSPLWAGTVICVPSPAGAGRARPIVLCPHVVHTSLHEEPKVTNI